MDAPLENQWPAIAATSPVALKFFDRSDTGIFIVKSCGHLVFANGTARRLIQEGRGLCVRHGRLMAHGPDVNSKLSSLIRGSHVRGDQRESVGVLSIGLQGCLPLTALVAPLVETFDQVPPPVIVFVRDPNHMLRGVDVLQSLFDLTPAEARITLALANGQSLGTIAQSHEATLQTVRKQLKLIFAKTGTSRQAQLVTLVLRSVLNFAQG